MRKQVLAKLQSFGQTLDLCKKKSERFKHLPEFSNHVLLLEDYVLDMHKQIQIIQISTRGHTLAKKESRATLTAETLTMAEIAMGYASNKKDRVMMNAVNLTKTSLIRCRESLIGDRCTIVLNICVEKLEVLKAYGLTKEKNDSFKAIIEDFSKKLLGTPEYRSTIEVANELFTDRFGKTKLLLKGGMDPLAKLLNSTDMELFMEYSHSRIAVMPARRKLSLKCKVMEKDTNRGIRKVEVVFVMVADANGNAVTADAETHIKFSSNKGCFQIKCMGLGEYSVTAKKGGVKVTVPNVYVVEGETTVLEIFMSYEL